MLHFFSHCTTHRSEDEGRIPTAERYNWHSTAHVDCRSVGAVNTHATFTSSTCAVYCLLPTGAHRNPSPSVWSHKLLSESSKERSMWAYTGSPLSSKKLHADLPMGRSHNKPSCGNWRHQNWRTRTHPHSPCAKTQLLG